MSALPVRGATAVIFTSRRTGSDGDASASDAAYAQMSEAMLALAAQQPGFISVTSARDPASGQGITVSYWADEASARSWKAVAEHLEAQRRGRDEWYAEYEVVVAEVVRAYRGP